MKTKKAGKNTGNSKKLRIFIIITVVIGILAGICIGFAVHYRNTPEQKVLRLGNTIMNSFKSNVSNANKIVNTEVEHMLAHCSYVRASEFKYTLDSIERSADTYETYTCTNMYESEDEFESDVRAAEKTHPASDGWIEDKISHEEVTFKSSKYKVSNYVLTYSINYTIDGTAKSEKVSLNIQEQNHGKGNYIVVGFNKE